jgi:hypothetical protein
MSKAQLDLERAQKYLDGFVAELCGSAHFATPGQKDKPVRLPISVTGAEVFDAFLTQHPQFTQQRAELQSGLPATLQVRPDKWERVKNGLPPST